MQRPSRRNGYHGACVRYHPILFLLSQVHLPRCVTNSFLFLQHGILDILACQAQQYAEDVERPSDILFELRDRIPKDKAFWLINVDNALTNVFLRDGEVRLAIGSLDRMIDLLPAATREEVRSKFPGAPNFDELERVLSMAYKCEILSRQGRVMLQVGALPQVAELFEMASTLSDTLKLTNIPAELQSLNAVKVIPAQMEINAGLFYFSKNEFEKAIQSFSLALEILRKLGDLTPKYHLDDWMGSSIAASYEPNVLYSECVNNMALCYLYTCRMKTAVTCLEV
jgi:tetratricopeptide (TPR) repeat protein